VNSKSHCLINNHIVYYAQGLATMKSLRDVKGFHYMTRKRDLAATINIVEVYGDAGSLSALNAVQQVLRRTLNITSLTLIFSFEPALRVLPTTQVFNNLTDLNVNAPHSALIQFLIAHSLISSLVVGKLPCLRMFTY